MSPKLIRDKIPELIIQSGKIPKTHIASNKEFHDALKTKLTEECQEYLESEEAEELADILEVIDALRELRGMSKDELNQIKENKAIERGTFVKKIILDN